MESVNLPYVPFNPVPEPVFTDVKDYGPGPHVAVDAVVIAWEHSKNRTMMLAVTRKDGTRALPGGFVDASDKSLSDAAKREVQEETGLELYGVCPIPLPVRASKNRDKRSWVISHPFLYIYGGDDLLPVVQGADDVMHAEWIHMNCELDHTWFADHLEIIQSAEAYLKGQTHV